MLKRLTPMKTALLMMALIIISSGVATWFPHLHIYQSLWYRGLLLLLCLSLFFCTIRSLKSIFSTWHTTPTPSSLKQGNKQPLPETGQVGQTMTDYFTKAGYRVDSNREDQYTIITIQKGMLNRLAPHILHLSLVVVFLGAFFYSFGTREDIPCYVGESVTLPAEFLQETTLRVDDFVTLYDSQGHIDNWLSKITLLEGDQTLTSGQVQVNHPFSYRGVKFYQAAYGHEYLIKVTGENAGQYRLPEGKAFRLAGQQFRLVQGHSGLVINIYDGVAESSIPLKEGTVIDFPQETQVEYQGLVPYTILNIKHTPGGSVVLIGLVLMSLASFPFWTTRYRRVDILIDHQQGQGYIKVNCKDKAIKNRLDEEIKQLVKG